MAVKKNQRIPDMGNLSDIPKSETLARSNVTAPIRQPGAGKVVDPHAGVNKKGSYKT